MTPYYRDDWVTIYHGDCREVLPGLGRFDLLLTDPPYGIGFAAQPTDYQRANGMKPAEWDNKRPDPQTMLMAFRLTDRQVVWGGNYFSLPTSRGWFAWCKPDAPPSMGNLELAWTSEDRIAKHFIYSIAATNGERLGHPTQKPLQVILWCLSFFPGAHSILDPFMGSGTTLRAAKDLQRHAIGIEIEERYCEIAAKRCAQEVLNLTP
jgi:DNA modification methylase